MRRGTVEDLCEWYPELRPVKDWKGIKREWGVIFPDGFATSDFDTVYTKRLVDEGKLSESALETSDSD